VLTVFGGVATVGAFVGSHPAKVVLLDEAGRYWPLTVSFHFIFSSSVSGLDGDGS
jgi:hypothetical protein